jgi:hypothetical protein
MKLTSVLLSTLSVLAFINPCQAEDRTFSPTEFKVCGEDSNFTRPTIENLTNNYIERGDRSDIKPKKHTKKQNQQLVLKLAGKLFTTSSLIYNAKSGAYGYDTRILSGEWNSNIKKWNCSNLADKLSPMGEGDVSLVALFGYRVKSIRQTGYNYIMTVSNRRDKGIQYIAVDRSLNGKLKIRTVEGEILELVDLQGQKDFKNKPDSYLNDRI